MVPKELTRETRRAAARLGEVAADRSHWSSGKVILDLGREHGLDLDDVADPEELQARLDMMTELWNAQPISERRRLMPDPSGRGLPRDDLTGAEAAMAAADSGDPVKSLVMTFADRLPAGELPPPEISGPLLRDAPYLRQVLALSLDRLWWGACTSGLVDFVGRRVVGVPVQQDDDEGWLALGVTAVQGLLERLEERGYLFPIVIQALMTSYVG